MCEHWLAIPYPILGCQEVHLAFLIKADQLGLTSDAHLQEVCDFTVELHIKVGISVSGTTKMCRPSIELQLIRVCQWIIVNMHKYTKKLSGIDPVTNARVSLGTMQGVVKRHHYVVLQLIPIYRGLS